MINEYKPQEIYGEESLYVTYPDPRGEYFELQTMDVPGILCFVDEILSSVFWWDRSPTIHLKFCKWDVIPFQSVLQPKGSLKSTISLLL